MPSMNGTSSLLGSGGLGWIVLAAVLGLASSAAAQATDQPPPTEDAAPGPVESSDPPTEADTSTSTGSTSTGSTSTGSTSTGSTSTGSTSTGTGSTGSTTTGSTATITTTRRTHTATEPGRVSTGGAAPLAEEEEPEPEGDGRDVDFIWFELEGGVSTVDLIAFRDTNFVSLAAGEPAFDNLRGTGPMAGLGVGFRIYWLTVGARGTYANYQNFDIGTIGGDLALRFPIPVVEPYIRAGLGYAWQGQANYRDPAMSATTVYGWSFDAALGVDIYLANWFTIGAGAGLNLRHMSRQSDPRQPCMGATDICPGNPGDAVGYQLRGFIQVGFRF